MGWQASNERGFSPASSLESPPARPPCSQSTMPGMLVLLSFLASLLFSCLCFPSVWASITGGDEFLDAHEAGLAVVASRKCHVPPSRYLRLRPRAPCTFSCRAAVSEPERALYRNSL